MVYEVEKNTNTFSPPLGTSICLPYDPYHIQEPRDGSQCYPEPSNLIQRAYAWARPYHGVWEQLGSGEMVNMASMFDFGFRDVLCLFVTN